MNQGYIEKTILDYLNKHENPTRIALSRKYPFLKKPILLIRHLSNNITNTINPNIKYDKSDTFYDCIVSRHQSLLRRKLGDSNPKLQEQKVQNLKTAVKYLNGIIIEPGKTFSLWQILGKPSAKKGYVNGMLLSNGKVVEGLGGGLCQLSNFLFWIFMHAPTEIVERYHHSMDVFPDSGRTLPFGSGATILYNFIDLKIKNTSDKPLQLKLWLTNSHLKGNILSPERIIQKYHLHEKNHFFIKKKNTYYRYNEIYRTIKINGNIFKTKKLLTNFAPVLYEVNNQYIEDNNFNFIEINKKPKLKLAQAI